MKSLQGLEILKEHIFHWVLSISLGVVSTLWQTLSENWWFQNLVFQPISLPFFSYLSRQTKKPRITRRHRSIWSVQGKFQSFSIAVESSFFINNTHIHTDSSFSSIYRVALLYFLCYHIRINLPWVSWLQIDFWMIY